MPTTQREEMTQQDAALEKCKMRIEQQLAWGDAETWASQDYDELSERIQEATGRVISATTLKRLWGRVAYNSRPSRHSLDTLAAFLGHDSWRAFTDTLEPEETASPASPSPPRASQPPARRRIPHTTLYLFCSITLLGGALGLWSGLTGPSEATSPVAATDVLFRSRPVAQGLPNTVIFDYDVRGVTADSFFIQQSWDQRRRALVSPQSQTFTSTYYYPGFFNAKLIADSTVLKEHPVHVTTDGWLALVENEPMPIYLQEAFEQGVDYLSVSSTWLRNAGIDAGDEYQLISFYNVRPFDSLHTDHFSMETTLRNGMDDGRYPCKRAEITVIGERSALMIPLGIPGCIGDMGVMLGDVYLDGTTNDLSAFGTDLSTWQPILVDVKERQVTIKVGANPPFTRSFTMDIGYLVGLRFRFEGTGAVDYVKLKDEKGALVYEESFF